MGHSSRPTSEVLEELVGGVRSIGSKILDTRTVISGSSEYTRPYNTWSFKNILEYQYGSAEYPIWIIMIGSIFRFNPPWIYELSRDAYEAKARGDGKRYYIAMRVLVDILKSIEYDSVEFNHFGIERKDLHDSIEKLERLSSSLSSGE